MNFICFILVISSHLQVDGLNWARSISPKFANKFGKIRSKSSRVTLIIYSNRHNVDVTLKLMGDQARVQGDRRFLRFK